jgi:hypothetical protein
MCRSERKGQNCGVEMQARLAQHKVKRRDADVFVLETSMTSGYR